MLFILGEPLVNTEIEIVGVNSLDDEIIYTYDDAVSYLLKLPFFLIGLNFLHF